MPTRAFAAALAAAILLAFLPVTATADSILPSVSAESAILIDAASGRVLFEKNSHSPMAQASTTKIMTALIALERGDPDKPVQIDPRAIGVEGSSVYLRVGEAMTLRELIYCLMLASANDAAAAIAYEIAGGITEFAELMNKKARELGLFSTHFENPHGLHTNDHKTTASELARLTAYALKNEAFAEIVSCKTKIIDTNVTRHALSNHNRLLRSYEGCIGVKTGFTKSSGRCLVSAARRDGLTLIAVTLRAPDDWNDHRAMLDYGFSHYRAVPLCHAGQSFYEMPVVSGEAGRVFCVAERELYFATASEAEITVIVECRRFLFGLPESGVPAGRVIFYRDGEPIGEMRLIYIIM